MSGIVISGKYLTYPINGIPRYANEVVKLLIDGRLGTYKTQYNMVEAILWQNNKM